MNPVLVLLTLVLNTGPPPPFQIDSVPVVGRPRHAEPPVPPRPQPTSPEPQAQPPAPSKPPPPRPIQSATDWPLFRGNQRMTGVANTSLPDTLVLRWRFDAPDAIESTAAIVGDAVFVGCNDGAIRCIDLASGKLRWKHTPAPVGDTPTQPAPRIASSPAVVDGTVYVGNDAGRFIALDARTGRPQWTFDADAEIISSPNVAGDRVVFGSYDGNLICLRRTDGQRLWTFTTDGRVHSSPAISGNYVLFAGCDEFLHVNDLTTGKPIRRLAMHSVAGATPALCGSTTVVGLYGNQVLAVDWTRGKPIWTFEDPDRQFPFLSSAAIQCPSDPTSVSGRAQQGTKSARTGVAVIGGRDKRLRAFDLNTGKVRWTFVTRGRIDSSPVISGQRVYVGSLDGNVYAVDLNTGRETWRYETGEGISASPAVAAGCLIIGNHAGVLHCFAAPQ